MFQTEPILALQSVEWLQAPLWLVSQLGYTPFYVSLLLLIVFTVDFRRGFVLVQIVSWNGILTDALKAHFALPRPDAVDSRVQLGGRYPNPVRFEAMGAARFFDPLPAEVVSHYRGLGDFSLGFPSGHCSSTTAVWGTIAILFERRVVRVLALLVIVVMPLSRMYLGRHFVADVLGGAVQGVAVIAAAWLLALRAFAGGEPTLAERLRETGVVWRNVGRYGFLFFLPMAAVVLPGVDLDSCARLMGVNVAWVLLARRGLPLDGGKVWQRGARFLLAVVSYVVVALAAGRAAEALAGGETEWTEAIAAFAAAAAALWGASELALKLHLFAGRGTTAT